MKSTEPFYKAIETYLKNRAEIDELFAETFKKPNKNVGDCVTYILNQVKASGCNGFTDDEIFGMAVHFYDEDDIKPGAKINAKVVVNHVVELTEEDKAAAKQKAFEKEVESQREKIVLETKVELTEEDMEKVKKQAIDEAVESEKQRLLSKTKKKKEDKKPQETAEQTSLFG